jgi:hypothetical protein
MHGPYLRSEHGFPARVAGESKLPPGGRNNQRSRGQPCALSERADMDHADAGTQWTRPMAWAERLRILLVTAVIVAAIAVAALGLPITG